MDERAEAIEALDRCSGKSLDVDAFFRTPLRRAELRG
jgi:hypothetical protein